jgi:hypothetical protein
MYRDDREAFQRASESEEWQVTGANAIERYGVTMTVAGGEEAVMPAASA